jgi:hypothetical protein
MYKLSQAIRLKSVLKNMIMPAAYKEEIMALDNFSG